MGQTKEPNVGTLPCMVCGEPMNYLNTQHMRSHDPEKPQTVPKYRDWVAEQSGLEREHPLSIRINYSNLSFGGRTNNSSKGGEIGSKGLKYAIDTLSSLIGCFRR